jgi:hypothetical protein
MPPLEVPHGEQGGHHRVVLIVVLVHSVATHHLEVGKFAQGRAYGVQVGLVARAVDRVGLLDPDNGPVRHAAGAAQPELGQLAFPQLD